MVSKHVDELIILWSSVWMLFVYSLFYSQKQREA